METSTILSSLHCCNSAPVVHAAFESDASQIPALGHSRATLGLFRLSGIRPIVSCLAARLHTSYRRDPHAVSRHQSGRPFWASCRRLDLQARFARSILHGPCRASPIACRTSASRPTQRARAAQGYTDCIGYRARRLHIGSPGCGRAAAGDVCQRREVEDPRDDPSQVLDALVPHVESFVNACRLGAWTRFAASCVGSKPSCAEEVSRRRYCPAASLASRLEAAVSLAAFVSDDLDATRFCQEKDISTEASWRRPWRQARSARTFSYPGPCARRFLPYFTQSMLVGYQSSSPIMLRPLSRHSWSRAPSARLGARTCKTCCGPTTASVLSSYPAHTPSSFVLY